MPLTPAQRLAAAYDEIDAVNASVRGTLDCIKVEGRNGLTPAESAQVDSLFARRDAARAIIDEIDGRSNDIRPTQAASVRSNGIASRQTASVSVGREERTYHEGRDRELAAEARTEYKPGQAFLLDVGRAFLGDPEATERLARHQHEHRIDNPRYQERASGTGQFTGLVVPQYLTDMFAPAVTSGRPFANICTPHDLPPIGMTVNIGRLTTGSSVGMQATENTTVSTADPDDTLVTENVQTAAGYVTISRQAIERGVLTEQNVTGDLLAQLAAAVEGQLIGQSVTGLDAQASGTTTAYTTTGPTAAGLYPKLAGAVNNIETALLGIPGGAPTHYVMHPRRFRWLASQLSSSWPLVGTAGIPPQMMGMELTNEYGTSVKARTADGMLIVTSSKVPANQGASTNQDAIYAVAAGQCHLWEQPEVMLRAEQPQAPSMGILFLCYQYLAYSFRLYPGAVASVTGSGLISPVF